MIGCGMGILANHIASSMIGTYHIRGKYPLLASSKKIKARIEDLISKEDKRKPLSDQEIAELLKREGFLVARRTVAKYRDHLGIFAARMRRQY